MVVVVQEIPTKEIAEYENKDEFIPEIDINDSDEGFGNWLSDEVFDDMFQEAFYACDYDTVNKNANEKLFRWFYLFISL